MLLGGSIPWVTIKDGSFLDPDLGDGSFRGFGINTEAGVTVFASPQIVRVVDGTSVVAEHARSCTRRRQCARNGYTLTLTAGKFVGLVMRSRTQAHAFQRAHRQFLAV